MSSCNNPVAKARQLAGQGLIMTERREQWHDGWPRVGNVVYVEDRVCCAGCGRVVSHMQQFVPGEATLPPEPRWPFPDGSCPVCETRVPPDKG